MLLCELLLRLTLAVFGTSALRKWRQPQVLGSNPDEPANCTGSYTTRWKEILDTEIAMHGNAGIIITTSTVTIASRAIAITAMQMLSLLKLTVSGQRGGLRN